MSEFGQSLLAEESLSASRLTHSHLNFRCLRGTRFTICVFVGSVATVLFMNFPTSPGPTAAAMSESAVRTRAAGLIAESNMSIALSERAHCSSKAHTHYDRSAWSVYPHCVCDVGYFNVGYGGYVDPTCVSCTSYPNQHWDDRQDRCVCDDGFYVCVPLWILGVVGSCMEFKFGVFFMLNVLVVLSGCQCLRCMWMVFGTSTMEKQVSGIAMNMDTMDKKLSGIEMNIDTTRKTLELSGALSRLTHAPVDAQTV